MREFGTFISNYLFIQPKNNNNNNDLFEELVGVKDRNIEDLSGGELQRFACAVTCVRNNDM